MTLSEADIAAIRAAIEEDAAAVRRADWDAVVRMFTADAIRFPLHQAPIRGRAAMRVAWDVSADSAVRHYRRRNRRLRRCRVRARPLRADGRCTGIGADDRSRQLHGVASQTVG